MKTQNDDWITVKPNGEENKGRHLLLEGDESPKEAIDRKWKKKPAITPSETAAETVTPYKERYKDFFTKYEAAVKEGKESLEERKKSPELLSSSEKRSLEKGPAISFLSAYISERSSNIKQDLKKYSSKTDELVKSLNAMEDTPREKELQGKLEEIKERKKELQTSKDSSALGEIWALETQELFLKNDLKQESSNAKAEQVLKIINKKNTNFKLKYNSKPSTKEIADKLDAALSGFIGDGIMPEDAVVEVKSTRSRREFEANGSINFNKNTDLPTAIHEYMHFVEEKNPRILANSLAFARMRTEGEKTRTLKSMTGQGGYKGEYAKPDKFFDPYCGKMYSADGTYEHATASEIMSMGLQQIVTNPKKFAEEDREYFDFVIANIKGDI